MEIKKITYIFFSFYFLFFFTLQILYKIIFPTFPNTRNCPYIHKFSKFPSDTFPILIRFLFLHILPIFSHIIPVYISKYLSSELFLLIILYTEEYCYPGRREERIQFLWFYSSWNYTVKMCFLNSVLINLVLFEL